MPRILKQDAERLLANVPEEHVFRCYDGCVLRNVKELGESFASMSDETFTHHSNEEKRDFSNWVKDIIGDEKLARDLGKSLNRTQAAKSVAARIDFLSAKLV